MVGDRDSRLMDAALRLVDSGTRKAIKFDLDTARLVEEAGRSDTRQAHSEIRGVLRDLGYDHSRHSGYVSLGHKSTSMAFDDLETLSDALPWFLPSCKKCHVTTVLPFAFDWLAAHAMEEAGRDVWVGPELPVGLDGPRPLPGEGPVGADGPER